MWAFELNKNDCSNGVFNSNYLSASDFTFFDSMCVCVYLYIVQCTNYERSFLLHNAKWHPVIDTLRLHKSAFIRNSICVCVYANLNPKWQTEKKFGRRDRRKRLGRMSERAKTMERKHFKHLWPWWEEYSS